MSSAPVTFVCSFASLDGIPTKQLTNRTVLKALRQTGRISIFELTERPKLARIINQLEERKVIQLPALTFPWFQVIVKTRKRPPG
jgi:hypothetical protein